MGRKRSKPAAKKQGGGLLMGMRGGLKGTVNAVTGAGGDKKKASLASNLLTGALVIAAAVLLLRRCGYVRF